MEVKMEHSEKHKSFIAKHHALFWKCYRKNYHRFSNKSACFLRVLMEFMKPVSS